MRKRQLTHKHSFLWAPGKTSLKYLLHNPSALLLDEATAAHSGKAPKDNRLALLPAPPHLLHHPHTSLKDNLTRDHIFLNFFPSPFLLCSLPKRSFLKISPTINPTPESLFLGLLSRIAHNCVPPLSTCQPSASPVGLLLTLDKDSASSLKSSQSPKIKHKESTSQGPFVQGAEGRSALKITLLDACPRMPKLYFIASTLKFWSCFLYTLP